ncbi:hypothetical protein DN397_22100 [Bacillus sp. AY1-10]|nr:hypothetical protein DN397_22100 [Bacillus sp. AY1-10]
MIPEKVIGCKPIFIIQVTSLIYKKGLITAYENLSNKVTNSLRNGEFKYGCKATSTHTII